MKRLLGAVALVAAMTSGAAAGEHDNPFAQLGFLAGDWRQTTKGETVEEHWVGPIGGVMGGMTITYSDKADGKTKIEFMSVEQHDGKIVFVARLDGQPPTEFPLKESDNGYAVFENPEHDFPQRVIYSLGNEAATLDARIEGKVNGEDAFAEWHYERIAR